MDSLAYIKQPIVQDLACFERVFDETLNNTNSYLSQIFSSIKKKGKLMRPILLLLVAKEYGEISHATYLSAVTLEMLHTASLIHDDVVDESNERRGNASINSLFGNQIAVLAGDYLLSTALIKVCETKNVDMITRISELGRQLSQGEILQLKNTSDTNVSEQSYFEAIKLKTAALFATCAELGVLSVHASNEVVLKMRKLGELIGICFQIRDDIFDYYDDNVGKPTGNDLAEGKITLPLIYALNNNSSPHLQELVSKVKSLTISKNEIGELVQFAKEKGGIEYAQEQMRIYAEQAKDLIKSFKQSDLRDSLNAYIDFVTQRSL